MPNLIICKGYTPESPQVRETHCSPINRGNLGQRLRGLTSPPPFPKTLFAQAAAFPTLPIFTSSASPKLSDSTGQIKCSSESASFTPAPELKL